MMITVFACLGISHILFSITFPVQVETRHVVNLHKDGNLRTQISSAFVLHFSSRFWFWLSGPENFSGPLRNGAQVLVLQVESGSGKHGWNVEEHLIL